ncbi:hypothetical protein [Neisseria meningitidis]|uniref:hypothetical protein n=1 Tax=Neisseria meningitidis TaxID=487 RepID=UPI000A8450A1|nr:hypothetical protein [Neisseria meningitidis]
MTKGCGNHGNGEVSDGIVHPPPSFPRRRESNRHSRAGGNPLLWATAIFKDYPKV